MRQIRTLTGSLLITAAALLCPHDASADEGGVSFWVPGFFGSLAAAPLQPGFALTSIYYHTTVSADADVARAREITVGRLPATLAARVTASLDADADIAFVIPSYTFDTKVLGGQLNVALITAYGHNSASVDATLNAALLVGPFALAGSRFYSVSDAVTGFGDLIPQASLRWNAGVHNYMVYATGDIPVGCVYRELRPY